MKRSTDHVNQVDNALRLTALFFLTSIAWIVLSDYSVNFFLEGIFNRATAQTIKGLLYVSVTAILVFWLSKRAYTCVAHKATTALAYRTEHLLNTIMTNLGEAVIQVEASTRTILGCNSAVTSILGYSTEELIGKTAAIFYENEEAFQSFVRTGWPVLEKQGIFRYECVLRHKDGSPVNVEITVVALDKDLGLRTGVVSIIRDLTSQKRAEAKMLESERQ